MLAGRTTGAAGSATSTWRPHLLGTRLVTARWPKRTTLCISGSTPTTGWNCAISEAPSSCRGRTAPRARTGPAQVAARHRGGISRFMSGKLSAAKDREQRERAATGSNRDLPSGRLSRCCRRRRRTRHLSPPVGNPRSPWLATPHEPHPARPIASCSISPMWGCPRVNIVVALEPCHDASGAAARSAACVYGAARGVANAG